MAIDASITLVLDMGGHMVRIAKDSPYRLAQDGVKGLEAADISKKKHFKREISLSPLLWMTGRIQRRTDGFCFDT